MAESSDQQESKKALASITTVSMLIRRDTLRKLMLKMQVSAPWLKHPSGEG